MSEVIDEHLVQWVLLKDIEYFTKLLDLPVNRCLGTEVTTDYGRVDFLFRMKDEGLLIVELETGINSNSKLAHCKSQITNYHKLSTQMKNKPSAIQVAIVYASDITPGRFQKELLEFAKETNTILRTYSNHSIIQRFNKMVDQINYTSGVSLSRAVALGVPSITWLKKFMVPFLFMDNKARMKNFKQLQDLLSSPPTGSTMIEWCINLQESDSVNSLPYNEVKSLFSSNTNFYVLKRLAEDFELVQTKGQKKASHLILTDYGKQFRDELLVQLQFQSSSGIVSEPISQLKDFTLSQRRLLLEILLNGNLTKIKVNIFHFLRFVHLTEGNWLPKQSSRLLDSEQQLLNNFFKSSYNKRTLKDLVINTCSFCFELGLVKKISAKDQIYDKVIFTTLGSRVYNYFEQLLHVERERHQIPLQVDF
jgi:hypothetical protein